MPRDKQIRKDFSNKSLKGEDLSNTDFICCDFTNTDLSDANCSNSSFAGSILKGTKCNRTNFTNAQLACIFEPSDVMDMTITISCKTFTGMSASSNWWYVFLYFAIMMSVPKEAGKDPRDKLIGVFGAEKYLSLKRLFSSRRL